MRQVCILSVLAFVIFLSNITSYAAQQNAFTRSCIAKDFINDGPYTYIRCLEGTNDIWLSTVRTPILAGDKVAFIDAPPMIDFESRSLGRTFSRIMFTTAKKAEQENPFRTEDDSVYSGTDENGTIVFSDNPAKVPNRRSAAHSESKGKNKASKSLPSVRNSSPVLKAPKSSTKEENTSKIENSVERGQANNFDDSLLVSMWNSMVSCISRNDTASALNYIHPRARQQYMKMFTTLKPKLPEIMSTRRNFKLITAGERKATYELTTSEVGGQYSYEVVFVKDENKWWIYEF